MFVLDITNGFSHDLNSAWIGSVQYSLVLLPALLVGRLFDLGWFRLPYALGSVSLVLSVFLTAQCTEYWHFVVCQGLMVGVSLNSIDYALNTMLIFQ